MKAASSGLVTLLAVCVANACSGDSAQTLPGSGRLLCATCEPSPAEGGETGDFVNGSTDGCPVTVTDVGRDFDEAGLSAPVALQLVERSASAPGRYRPSRYFPTWAGAAQISGYAAEPIVDVSVEVTRIRLVEEVPGSVRGSQCSRRWLQLDANVSVDTSDGSLSGRFENGSVQIYGGDEAQLVAAEDASSFRGSLDFGDGHEPPIAQMGANLALFLSEEGVRGRLDLAVALAGGAETTAGAIALEWPADACEPEQTPVSADVYLPVLQRAQAVARARAPVAAQWRGRADTELSLRLDAPIGAACRTRSDQFAGVQETTYELSTSVQLATSDARLSGSLPGVLEVGTDDAGAFTVMAFSAFERFRAEELESKYGVHGVDLLGAECGVMSFYDNLNLTSGSLQIRARPCDDSTDELADSLRWCPGPPCDFGDNPLL